MSTFSAWPAAQAQSLHRCSDNGRAYYSDKPCPANGATRITATQAKTPAEQTQRAFELALGRPADARHEGRFWLFSLPESGIEPLLRALIDSDAGILSLSIERAGLHDAFVHIAGEAAAQDCALRWKRGDLGEGSLFGVQCSHGTVMTRGSAGLQLFQAPTGVRLARYPVRDPGSAGREFWITSVVRDEQFLYVGTTYGFVKVTAP